MTSVVGFATNDLWQSTNDLPYFTMMALFLLFLLGIANFAMHKAVIESAHPLLGSIPLYGHVYGPRVSLAVEFVILVAAMLLVWSGSPGWGWFYFAYSLLNALAAWLILTDRI